MITFFGNNVSANYEKLAYDFSFKDLDGTEFKLSEYKNKVLVVTNVASYCGFTSQYEGLQEVWEKYQKKGWSKVPPSQYFLKYLGILFLLVLFLLLYELKDK